MISGSLLLFMPMFISGIFFERAWCGRISPIAGLSKFALTINSRNVNVKKLRIICHIIFSVWAGIILLMFIMAGGIKGNDPLRLTENGISVGAPVKYIIYYFVLAVFVIPTLSIGKRGAFHSIC